MKLLVGILCVIFWFIAINIDYMLWFYNNFMGNSSFIKKDFDSAKNYFQSTKNSFWVYNLANTFYKQKDYKQAKKLYLQIDDLPSKDANFRLNHNLWNTHYRLFQQKQDIKNIEQAIVFYKKALALKYDEETQKNLDFVENILKKSQKNQEQDMKKNSAEQRWDNEKSPSENTSNESKTDESSEKKDTKSEQDTSQTKENIQEQAKLTQEQKEALEQYEQAREELEKKNKNSFWKIYKDPNSMTDFDSFFSNPFFEDDFLKSKSDVKDW